MFVSIEKASLRSKSRRKPWARTRTQKRLTALEERMARALKLDLVGGLTKFKAKIEPEKVYQAWLTKDWSKVEHSIPWDKLPEELDEVPTRLGSAFEASSQIEIQALPAPVKPLLRLDLRNPRILRYTHRQTARLITRVDEDSKDCVRNLVRRSFDEALTPRRIAERIKDSVGLLPQHQDAVDRYRQGLTEKGVAVERADQLASDYAARLLDYRGMMIGRTEIGLATNQGQLAVWQQAADEGLLNREQTRKVWQVDGDPCDICIDMDGVAVPLDGVWTLSTGDVVSVPRESHPHCMCEMTVDFGEVTEE